MDFQVTYYTGFTQIPPYSRYAYEFGPILLAAMGPWNNTVDALVMPSGLNPLLPAVWLQPIVGQPLHFQIVNQTSFTFIPYFEINDQQFDVYPLF